MYWAGIASTSQGHSPVANDGILTPLPYSAPARAPAHLSLSVLLNVFGPDGTWESLNFQSPYHQKGCDAFGGTHPPTVSL